MMSKVTDFIQKQISEGLYPGASLALFQQGKWQEYYLGTTNGKEPVRANLAYDLASVSKVVGVGTLCIFWSIAELWSWISPCRLTILILAIKRSLCGSF